VGGCATLGGIVNAEAVGDGGCGEAAKKAFGHTAGLGALVRVRTEGPETHIYAKKVIVSTAASWSRTEKRRVGRDKNVTMHLTRGVQAHKKRRSTVSGHNKRSRVRVSRGSFGNASTFESSPKTKAYDGNFTQKNMYNK